MEQLRANNAQDSARLTSSVVRAVVGSKESCESHSWWSVFGSGRRSAAPEAQSLARPRSMTTYTTTCITCIFIRHTNTRLTD